MVETQLIHYHLQLLTDTVRMEAFQQAIAGAVSPGDVVVDIGCGSGALSFFACQAGARRVYAIEEGPVIDLARDLAVQNGFADRITFLAGRSVDVDVPEPADVLISETLWNFGLGEGIIPAVGDAVERWLRPGGVVVPQSFELMLAPGAIGSVAWFAEFDGSAYGLDFSGLRTASVNAVHSRWPGLCATLGPFTPVGRIGLPYGGLDRIELTGSLVVETAGRLDSLVGGFHCQLWGGVEVSNLPPDAAWNWAAAVFPLDPELEVAPGDRVVVEFTTYAREDATWTWDWRVERAGIVRAEGRQSTVHSTFRMGVLEA